MRKYIDAEKLTAEIERRTEETKSMKPAFDQFLAGPISVFKGAIKIEESLQQEQPDDEDIDKVAQELYEHLYELKRRNNVPTNLYDKQEIIDLWKAGVEYGGRNHPKQEQPEVYLEKAARNVYESWMGGTMNDVRRDMVNLGKVLNARKEK